MTQETRDEPFIVSDLRYCVREDEWEWWAQLGSLRGGRGLRGAAKRRRAAERQMRRAVRELERQLDKMRREGALEDQ